MNPCEHWTITSTFHSCSTNKRTYYCVKCLWELSKDIKESRRSKGELQKYINEDDFEWNEGKWGDLKNDITSAHHERIKKSNLEYPILVCNTLNGIQILDGTHRFIKTYCTVRLKLIPRGLLEKARIPDDIVRTHFRDDYYTETRELKKYKMENDNLLAMETPIGLPPPVFNYIRERKIEQNERDIKHIKNMNILETVTDRILIKKKFYWVDLVKFFISEYRESFIKFPWFYGYTIENLRFLEFFKNYLSDYTKDPIRIISASKFFEAQCHLYGECGFNHGVLKFQKPDKIDYKPDILDIWNAARNTHRVLIMLLLERKNNPDSVFYHMNLPLDMFKIIVKEADLFYFIE